MKRFFLITAAFLTSSAAFAQSKCVTAPVSVSGNQVTLTSSGNKAVTTNEQYIYFAHRHHKKHHECTVAAITDKYPACPLRMNAGKQVAAVPETYNLTLTLPQDNIAVCPDSAMNVVANINLEKVSSYTGNYPSAVSDNITYTKVSRHHYKMANRKMCKIKRNEAKVAKMTGTTVEAKSGQSVVMR